MPSFEEFPNNPLSFAPLPLGHNGIRKGRSAKLKGGRQLQPASSAPQKPSEQHLGHLGEPLRVPGAGQAGRVLTVEASTDGGCRLFAPLENQAHKGTGGCRGPPSSPSDHSTFQAGGDNGSGSNWKRRSSWRELKNKAPVTTPAALGSQETGRRLPVESEVSPPARPRSPNSITLEATFVLQLRYLPKAPSCQNLPVSM